MRCGARHGRIVEPVAHLADARRIVI